MSRDDQQIRATAIQMALALVPHLQITESKDLIAIAEQISDFINPPRSAIVSPVLTAISKQEVEGK